MGAGRFGGGDQPSTGAHGTESMARPLLYSSLVAGVLCGCQSAQHSACCDDCNPKPTLNCGYKPMFDNLATKSTAKGCAQKDLKELRKSGGRVSTDFADGFTQAYVDQALGRPALTPPVPASKYWNAYYRSCAGADAVAEWFEGYRTGLEIGGHGGVSRFNRVASSWHNGSGHSGPACPGGSCYPEAGVAPLAQPLLPTADWHSQSGSSPVHYSTSGRYENVVPTAHAPASRPTGS
ncbi:MAG: hypothetical protein B7Z55_09370 [Planctomycetales bacterium 12-60-4]|nr:MAG: hypothetical protein B7Z55_09370 [Planctomycetales bacterium 12-60-4]